VRRRLKERLAVHRLRERDVGGEVEAPHEDRCVLPDAEAEPTGELGGAASAVGQLLGRREAVVADVAGTERRQPSSPR
jgi:hypothetical protein